MHALLATDGSRCATDAIETFIATFDPDRCDPVRLVTVIDGSAASVGDDAAGRLRRARERPGLEALEQGRRALGAAGFRIEPSLLTGHPAEVIVEATRRADLDLAVVGSRGLGGVGRLLLGSVSSRVACYAGCPALVVHAPGPIRRVLVGDDGSADGALAVGTIRALPFRSLEAVLVVTCYDVPAPFLAGLAPTMVRQVEADHGEEVRAARVAAEAIAGTTAARLSDLGLPAVGIAESGRPSETLAFLATERSADLLAVGSRGRSAIAAFVLGSTSAALVTRPPTSILVAHHSTVAGT